MRDWAYQFLFLIPDPYGFNYLLETRSHKNPVVLLKSVIWFHEGILKVCDKKKNNIANSKF